MLKKLAEENMNKMVLENNMELRRILRIVVNRELYFFWLATCRLWWMWFKESSAQERDGWKILITCPLCPADANIYIYIAFFKSRENKTRHSILNVFSVNVRELWLTAWKDLFSHAQF